MKVILENDQMTGRVQSHAGHIIGYSNKKPIYCSGHEVKGSPLKGRFNFYVNDKRVITEGDKGITNCPCDGKGYTNIQGHPRFKVNGQSVVLENHRTNIHEAGIGRMVSRSASIQVGG